MKRHLFVLLAAAVSFAASSICLGVYRDTGGLISFSQPNKVQFQAHFWGDEFAWHMETDAGYAIIYNPYDQYFYYSQLDEAGEYTYTDLKVGIGDPGGLPLHLDRSEARKAEIQEQIGQFEIDCQLALQRFLEWQEYSTDDFFVVGVLLVETEDRQTQDQYTIQNFDNMLSSTGYYNTSINPEVLSPWPDLEEVCGSVKDYYLEVSRNQFYPLYQIINPENPENPGHPIWIELPGNFVEYGSLTTFFNDAVEGAVQMGWYELLQGYDQLCVMVADHYPLDGPGGAASWYTNPNMPDTRGAYLAWEKEWSWVWYGSYTFGHIGGHCHEYGHLLGLHFGGDGVGNSTGRQFMLMGTGNNPGPLDKGESPSHMGVAEKLNLEWVQLGVEVTEITSNMIQHAIGYDVVDPDFYYFSCPNGDKFFLENRHYSDFNSFLMGHDQPNNPQNMLLVHRCWGNDYYNEKFLCADNQFRPNSGRWWFGDDGDPFPGIAGVDSLSPLSPEISEVYPTEYGNVTYYYETTPKDHLHHQTGFALFNITSEGDHIVADLYHNYWAGELGGTSNWSYDWSGDDIIVGSPGVTVIEDFPLTIEAGSTVTFRPGAGIGVDDGGHLEAIGTSENPIYFLNDGHVSNSIVSVIGPTAEAVFEYCDFTDEPGFNLYCEDGKLTMRHCHIKSAATMDAILLAFPREVILDDVQIEGSDGVAVYCVSGNNVTIKNCIIGTEENPNLIGGIYLGHCKNVLLEGDYIFFNGNGEQINHFGGIHLDGTSPKIRYCYVEYNGNYQLGCFDKSAPIMYDPQSTEGFRNTLQTDLANLDHYPIYVISAFPEMKYGHNNVINGYVASTYLIYDDSQNPSGTRYVEGNYWGTQDPQATQFYPSQVTYRYIPFDTQPNPPPPGPYTVRDDSAYMFFNMALTLEEQGQYEQAIDQYKYVAENYSDLSVGSASLTRIRDCAVAGGIDLAEIRDYFQILSNQPLGSEFCYQAHLSYIDARVSNQEYYGAISDYEDILLSGPEFLDSIQVAIDLCTTWYLAELGGSPGPAGPCNIGRIPSLRTTTREEYRQKVDELWALKDGHSVQTEHAEVPTVYELRQNYPNPFNPVTTIRYALPEAAHVSITIYNILGRKVLTLVDTDQPAGYHIALWDSKSDQGIDVSSGIYFYRIIANDFVDAKKMVLLK